MLRVSGLLYLAVFLATFSSADNVTFLRLDKAILQQRIQSVPENPEQRLAAIRRLFAQAGCAREEMQQQAVPNRQQPNLICILPGSETGSIVVAAPLEYDMRGEEGRVGWATLCMLPALMESLQSAPHRHSYVFVAFAGGDSMAGSSHFLAQLSDSQKRDIRGMVAFDHLGRTAAQYAVESQGQTMGALVPASAKALHLPHSPGEATGIPPTDAKSFERAHVPAVTIYSPAVTTASALSTANDIAPDFRREAAHEGAAQGFVVKTGVDLDAYNETYNLLCVYMLFLDRGLPAGRRVPTQVASASSATAPGAAPPAAESSPVAPAALAPVKTEVAAATVPATPPSTPPPAVEAAAATQAPTFRATARLVQVDVVVMDKQGRPVTDLKDSDFIVLEDGKPQPVRAFEAHQSTTRSTAGTGPADAGQARTTQAALSKPGTYSNWPKEDAASSWTIVLFDILNTPTTDQSYARKELMDLVKAIPAGHPTAIFVLTQHLEMAQNFTDDAAQLVRVVEQLNPSKSQILTTETEVQRATSEIAAVARQSQPTASAQGAAISTDGMTQSMTSRIMQGYRDHEAFRTNDRVMFTLDAMKGIARAVSGYPGRKNLLWLSGSFPVQINPDPATQDEFRNEQGFMKEISGTSALLATSRVAVYPIDARGLQSRGIDISVSTANNPMMADPLPSGRDGGLGATSNSSLGATINDQSIRAADERTTMKKIAEQTGGEAFVNTNGLGRAMQRSLEDGSSYYTLAYTPPKDDAIGGYHRIEVKLDRPGTKLSYRRGYFLVPLTSGTNEGISALRLALRPGMPPATMLLLNAAVQPPDGTHKEARIQYIISPDGVTFADVPGGKKHAAIDCVAIAFDKEGREVGHASDTLDATFPASAYDQILKSGLPAQQEIALPPGLYNLKIGVMDRATQRIGTVDVPLTIPEAAVAQK